MLEMLQSASSPRDSNSGIKASSTLPGDFTLCEMISSPDSVSVTATCKASIGANSPAECGVKMKMRSETHSGKRSRSTRMRCSPMRDRMSARPPMLWIAPMTASALAVSAHPAIRMSVLQPAPCVPCASMISTRQSSPITMQAARRASSFACAQDHEAPTVTLCKCRMRRFRKHPMSRGASVFTRLSNSWSWANKEETTGAEASSEI
mmetsp:Transcript_15436/g.36108  ORF Transcript_15436/g.36108 Transcript_15436/m.36108 type:complete len:207 (+) Transcript_15436:1188-1808(+)